MPLIPPFDLVATALECDARSLTLASRLAEHPKWDSFGHLNVMMALEQHYGIVINDDTIRKFESMKAIVDLHGGLERQCASMVGFDSRWEQAVYGKGRHVNLYPFDIVVSTVLGRLGKMDREARSAMRFLEVGCGAGNNVWFLAREGFSVAGIDGSPSAIEFASARLAGEGLSAELKVGDISDLPWEDGSFDFVIDRGAITHNRRSHVEAALKEVHRVLRPEGRFFSQLFSMADDGWRYGQALGDGAFDHFKGGYFADISLTFFASSDDIDALFVPFFGVVSKKHCTVADALGGDTIAMWNVVCSRR